MIINCICGCSKYTIIGNKDTIDIVSCVNCGHWYIPKVADNYNEMYESGLYHNSYQLSIGHVAYKDRYIHDYNIASNRLDKLKKYIKCGTILDIGCSNGAFVHHANEYGYNAIGIDINQYTSEISDCYCTTIDTIDSNTKSVITMHDSIEHFIDMDYILSNIHRILYDNGLLVIEAPNFSCPEFIKERINWKHVRPIEHIHMMSISDYIYVLEKHKLNIMEITYPITGKLCIYARKPY
jgi:SAM-dependent methyltransferase